MFSHKMELEAERTLSNLHVLGALSHNDKLMTNEDSFDIYSPTSVRGMYRYLYGERRSSNLERVRQTIRAAMNFSERFLEEANALHDTPVTEPMRLRIDTTAMQHIRMCDALEQAKKGLQNLLQTYNDDAATSSRVGLILREIDDFFSVIRPRTEKLKSLCTHSLPVFPPAITLLPLAS